ncbi:uncharacterized protein BT62DRAFT_886931 [Guyanagaster necrorhizus]|uniref:DUF6534 domain-containing protein n=1 Tax=Guyanagaster necrorhizus TaxID=856835 RepID=A0A9P7W284_9AGAR|nr:uncharacterized protein BT62DRAFT_886931 [Guyanagaster necrorhizus MCA 3950]KAG7450026.1 hypothetical protein BT62DRAFT_886931 [Guyanagaster necrorhizus MCA 3950]
MYTLGPWLVGMCLDIFLQGILTSQFFNYYAWYGKSDTWKFTVGVGALAVMTSLKTIQADHHGSAIVWMQDIVYFNDLDSALQMMFFVWYQMGNAIMVAFIAFYVQCYFCYRLWAVSRRCWVVSPILFLFVFSLGTAAAATYYIVLADLRLEHWLSVHYATAFVGNVLLAVAMAYFLLHTKKCVLPETMNMLDSLVRLTFQTTTPAVVVALLNLIFIFLPYPYVKSISSSFIQPLPKLYAISMMWTLNARRDIRIASSSLSIYTSRSYAHDLPSPTFPRSPRFTHEIPMNSFQVLNCLTYIMIMH